MGKDAKFVVRLTVTERLMLSGLIADARTAKERALRARVFLKADADGPNWTDSLIAEAFEISPLTVARLRKRCVLEGLEAALFQRPQVNRKPRKLDGAGEARLVALACGEAPAGRSSWTMQLLADRLVELKIVDEISDETVRLTLKKTNFSRGVGSNGSSRPTPTPSSSARWRKC
jgi:transposase